MIKAMSCPAEQDLRTLSYYLHTQRIPHRISERHGEQTIWVAREEHISVVEVGYRQWQHGELDKHSEQVSEQEKHRLSLNEVWSRMDKAPWTSHLIFASVIITLMQYLYGDMLWIQAFAISSFTYMHEHREYWRLVTPIFMHFTLPHLIFNMVMLWVFGHQIERREALWLWLGMVIFMACVGNLAELYATGPFFGGMSGVVYGVLGYCWICSLLCPERGYYVPMVFMTFMLLWLLLGFTSIPHQIGIGNMANAAHLAGLLSGLLVGLGVSIGSRLGRQA